MTPKRIQRKRTKGWRMPPNTVYVGRPTKWGNPFGVADVIEAFDGDELAARKDCVSAYRRAIAEDSDVLNFDTRYIFRLRGLDLACWCPLDQPCHADVLLELANVEASHPPAPAQEQP